MEAFLIQNLTTWIATLDGSNKLNFRGFDINALFTLSRTLLHFPFLHAAARFWNPVTHVFSFGGQEVCPTFEDFQALMESESCEEILPQFRFGHAQALGRMCGLTTHDARSLTCNGELDILELIYHFSDTDDVATIIGKVSDNMPFACVCYLTFCMCRALVDLAFA